MRRGAALAIGMGLGLIAVSARADEAADKARCLRSYVAGQEARERGRLRDARAEFEVCGQEACPAAARKDCLEWMAQVEASLPSIVLGAADDERDLRDVAVLIDGRPVATTLDGRALAIDPGPHQLRFEAEGHEPAAVDVIVLEGQKNRLVQTKLVRRGARVMPPLVGPPVADHPSRSLVAPLVTGGAAVVALGLFVGFAAAGVSQMHDLENGCGRTQSCQQDDVDSAHGKLVVGDVALVAAVLAGGITAYLLLTR